MKRTYILGALTASALASFAVPARPGLRPHTQPDGSVVMISVSGDERHKTITDERGRSLIMDEDGWLVEGSYAQAPATYSLRGSARRAASAGTGGAGYPAYPDWLPEGFNPGLCYTPFPTQGEPRALVILVEYQDVPFNHPSPRDYFRRMLNEEGFSDYGATGSARDFFVENSMGQFKPEFDVYGPVLLPKNRSYYGANDRWGNDLHPEQMAVDACRILDDEIDFSDYDLDGDGYIDNVFIFYADKGEATYGPMGSVWPHSAILQDLRPGEVFEYDGVLLGQYACTNETVIYNDEERPDGIGTFVHEFSHVLGLPDLYTTVYNNAFTPGEWSTLDFGPYNNEGRTPPYYSAYERFSLGWLEPELLRAGEMRLDPIQDSNHAYMVMTDRPNEYFLLESRKRTGADKWLPGHGMLVWHVDYNEKVWYDNEVNNVVSHQRVDIVEADGTQNGASRHGDTFPGVKGITAFGADTSPSFRSWSKQPVGFELSSIAEPEEGVVTFTVSGEGAGIAGVESGAGWSLQGDLLTAVEAAVVMDMQGRTIARLGAGESVRLPRRTPLIVVSAGEGTKVMI